MLKHILKRFFGFFAIFALALVFTVAFLDGGWGGIIIAMFVGIALMFGYSIVLFAECHWLRKYGQKNEMIFNIIFGLLLFSISMLYANALLFGVL
ncbi:MAG: hypothetical protein EOO50_02430 [Flavobacterium sp.]|uniref:hypothetical protein n=1 Tax=Flavobacterium sp. TaxID=239 RepID=UPI001210DDA5|nr:hypothetical protein [Flavobacterium sp.]RZJ68296.1 MAG: hypothetical protein EOO50_02430 [Flavobacterium sp.]